ncbi:transposase [Mycobacteroides stephanolepidis]|uniref:Transposase n=1 Tax=[Mycobacterium] stephanolepidis TaxID=1520670 RepID=A0A1Z4F1J6_9MYCO|nr:hypothetical protein [[Mycobacterium] stephanolepidis]BAX99078.1 transposase [[Mycobacterium] stephanolepidis]
MGVIVARLFLAEFGADVVRVAGVALEQVAADLGVHPMVLLKWMCLADVNDGYRPGVTSAESAQNRELRKWVRLLEQENEVLRRAVVYLSHPSLKLGHFPK